MQFNIFFGQHAWEVEPRASSGSDQPLVLAVPVLTMLGLISGSRHRHSDAPITEFPISHLANDFSSYWSSLPGSIILLGLQNGDFLFLSFLLLLLARVLPERKAFPYWWLCTLKQVLGFSSVYQFQSNDLVP